MEAYGETIALLETDQNYLTMWILRDKSSSSPWERKFSIAVPEVSSLRVTTSFQAVGFLPNGL
ncbi:hypothetical protein ACET3Z_007811 [Daucus carota]